MDPVEIGFLNWSQLVKKLRMFDFVKINWRLGLQFRNMNSQHMNRSPYCRWSFSEQIKKKSKFLCLLFEKFQTNFKYQLTQGIWILLKLVWNFTLEWIIYRLFQLSWIELSFATNKGYLLRKNARFLNKTRWSKNWYLFYQYVIAVPSYDICWETYPTDPALPFTSLALLNHQLYIYNVATPLKVVATSGTHWQFCNAAISRKNANASKVS